MEDRAQASGGKRRACHEHKRCCRFLACSAGRCLPTVCWRPANRKEAASLQRRFLSRRPVLKDRHLADRTLMFTDALPKQQLLDTLVAPPPPPSSTPPAAEAMGQVDPHIQRLALTSGQLRTPSRIPAKVQR